MTLIMEFLKNYLFCSKSKHLRFNVALTSTYV